MADAITIKALQDASLDAKSLEEVVNGDDAIQVTTRLGETYPSVKKAIKTMFENGGFPATTFDTKAKMTTEGASLADGDYAWVTDDTDANNGLYIKKSGVWVFSEFNVLKRVQDYVKRLDAKVMLEDAIYLDIATDKNGDAYRYTDASGGLHVTGLNKSGSIQSNVNSLHEQSTNIPVLANDYEQHIFMDSVGNILAYFDSSANLQMAGDVYKNGVIATNNGVASESVNQVRHQSVLLQQPKIKNKVDIATKAEDGLNRRMPFAIKTPTGLVYFYHKQIAGFDGDGTGSELWKAIISIDAQLNLNVVSRELFLAPDEPRGIVKHPTLGRTSDGRILLVFEKRLETTDPYARYQCYSSDEGLTFTTPTLIEPLGVNPAASSALGTTGTIVTAKNGRLLVPMYTLGGTCFAIYSDDDGVSWVYSDYLRPSSIGNEPSISLDMENNLVMDIRPKNQGYRIKALSLDNGETWQLFDGENLPSSKNQGVIFRDEKIGAMIQTHNAVSAGSSRRDHFTLSLSYDNMKTYPYSYMPYGKDWYGGYSQLIKWSEGTYILVMEYADEFIGLNVNENAGLIILSLSEVMSNVSYN